ncbi:glyoxalase/bleomycin resistance protein/dioxygenase [Nitrospirillum viridazoti Y2]|nr:glyoxalase/bleomycin resistance protein/dioxygenase [Nitrospirillum amazonense Y2]
MQARFLKDFGLVDLGLHGDVQLFASANQAPYCYIVELGEPRFIGFGLWVESTEVLETLAAREGGGVEPLGLPGGGSYVRMVDPDGFEIDAVAGQSFKVAAGPENAIGWNENGSHKRVDVFRRTAKGPSHVLRLGHLGLAVTDFKRSERWYKERFGFLTSEEFEAEPGTPLGAFMRADRGGTPTDHHTIVLVASPTAPRLRHVAFEVAGFDDLMAGREHLSQSGYKLHWGVGRHIFGSQIFDYWLDPYGREHEHWTDGDQLTAAVSPRLVSIDAVMGVQWGVERPNRN